MWMAWATAAPALPCVGFISESEKDTFRTILPPLTLWMPPAREYGGVAERLKAPVLKTGSAQGSLVGSNPTPSASESSIPRKLARPCRNPRAVLDL